MGRASRSSPRRSWRSRAVWLRMTSASWSCRCRTTRHRPSCSSCSASSWTPGAALSARRWTTSPTATPTRLSARRWPSSSRAWWCSALSTPACTTRCRRCWPSCTASTACTSTTATPRPRWARSWPRAATSKARSTWCRSATRTSSARHSASHRCRPWPSARLSCRSSTTCARSRSASSRRSRSRTPRICSTRPWSRRSRTPSTRTSRRPWAGRLWPSPSRITSRTSRRTSRT